MVSHDKALKIISKAWGRQRGFVFFPWIDGSCVTRTERIQAYHEGRPFRWPDDREAILQHMADHEEDDLYWCPSIFERRMRRADLAGDEHALWADLDNVDPESIEDYPPTVAWESSPGRYQALWLVTGGDVQGASWPGNENQRLTYHLGADPSGWDTTQLLRIPGWTNHKPEYRQNGAEAPRGKLLWSDGRRYLPDDFADLPEIRGVAAMGSELMDALAQQIDGVDRHAVWARVRLQVSRRCRDLVAAREVGPQRSHRLWEMERELADAGCTAVEIVAIVRETVWNKFDGRQDEVKQLLTEANKAIAARPVHEDGDQLEVIEDSDRSLHLLGDLLAGVEPPEWLVEGVLTRGGCGFIGGEPKNYKSWTGLDLAISVATGADFLDHFTVNDPGPVIYIQAEDGPAIVKDRYGKILPAKRMDKIRVDSDGALVWDPPTIAADHPPIYAALDATENHTLSDPGWQSWLDETLAKGYVLAERAGDPSQGAAVESYRLVVIDTLMTTVGDVDDKAKDMMAKVFRPLKMLARKHKVTLVIIHHMRKAKADGEPAQVRNGQRLLGTVAAHAWSEDSIYLVQGKGHVLMEVESKSALPAAYKIAGLGRTKASRSSRSAWAPRVTKIEDEPTKPARRKAAKEPGSGPGRKPAHTNESLSTLEALVAREDRPYSTAEIADHVAKRAGKPRTQTTYVRTYQQLKAMLDRGNVDRGPSKTWILPGHSADLDLDS